MIVQHPSVDPVARELATYERLGWRLTPANGKRPTVKGWPDKAVSNAERAANWLAKGNNLALVTGERSGVVVVDVDPRNGGETGLWELEQRYGKLPETLRCATGGDGLHIYLRHYPGAKTAKPANGIDYQVERRCVIVPPSIHPDTGNAYAWLSDPATTPIAEMPIKWRKGLSRSNADIELVPTDGPIPEGKRNQTLFDLARHLYGKGESESAVIVALTEHNQLRCDSPLEAVEVRQIARNAYRYKPTGQSHLTRFEQCVSRADLPRDQWCVAMALATFADVDGKKCFPTQEQIAERARYSLPKVKQATNALEAAGWLKRFKLGRDGAGWHYSYHLEIPPLNESDFVSMGKE